MGKSINFAKTCNQPPRYSSFFHCLEIFYSCDQKYPGVNDSLRARQRLAQNVVLFAVLLGRIVWHSGLETKMPPGGNNASQLIIVQLPFSIAVASVLQPAAERTEDTTSEDEEAQRERAASGRVPRQPSQSGYTFLRRLLLLGARCCTVTLVLVMYIGTRFFNIFFCLALVCSRRVW